MHSNCQSQGHTNDWVWRQGPHQGYYAVEFAIGLVFGPGGIEFKFIHDGRVVGYVECDYD
jgi:hypothetical protein